MILVEYDPTLIGVPGFRYGPRSDSCDISSLYEYCLCETVVKPSLSAQQCKFPGVRRYTTDVRTLPYSGKATRWARRRAVSPDSQTFCLDGFTGKQRAKDLKSLLRFISVIRQISTSRSIVGGNAQRLCHSAGAVSRFGNG